MAVSHDALAALWREGLSGASESAAALVIGHSGELELAFVACFPQADHRTCVGSFGPYEGARLVFAGEPAHFQKVEIIRGDPDLSLPDHRDNPPLADERLSGWPNDDWVTV